jgi:hypothetical protein
MKTCSLNATRSAAGPGSGLKLHEELERPPSYPDSGLSV